MAWTKFKTAAVTGVAVLLAAATTTVVVKHATRPVARQPGAGIMDRTTPKGAVQVMLNSVSTGDTQQYLKSFVFNSGDELELKATLERLVAADAKFLKAIRDRFGDSEAKALASTLPLMASPELFDSAQVNENGDAATLDAGQGPPIQMQKVDGEWKLTVAGMFHASPSDLEPMLARAIQAVEQTTVEIRQKKYQTAEAAVNAMTRKAR